jgi:hypothetical protein
MDPLRDALGYLKQLPRVVDAYLVTTFQCSRTTQDGSAQEVEVTLLDAGPDHGQAFARYRAVARTKDGKVGTGQPGPSAQAALALVPWADLDK